MPVGRLRVLVNAQTTFGQVSPACDVRIVGDVLLVVKIDETVVR